MGRWRRRVDARAFSHPNGARIEQALAEQIFLWMRPLGPLLTLILFFGVFWAELPTGSLVTVAIATVLILAGIKLAALLARRMRTSSMIRRAAEVRPPPGPALRTVNSHHSRPFSQKFADGRTSG